MYKYILFIILSIIVILFLYSRYKTQFWRIQPVFHFYDLHYHFCSPHIILEELPKTNKYCNFQNIETKTRLTKEDVNLLTKFTQYFYIQNKRLPENQFLPKKENILPYFPKDQKDPNFFSFYREAELTNDLSKTDSSEQIKESSKIIAVITSRPITVSFNKGIPLQVYYVDYLCVDPDYRKKGIAPQMIQTHEFKQRHQNPNIKVSLFKREGDITGITALTIYNTAVFDMEKWQPPAKLLPIVSLIECTKTNFNIVIDFLKDVKQQNTFDLTIGPSIETIMELITTKNIYIYFLLKEHEIKAIYFFKNTCVFVKKERTVLNCYASINNCKNPELFVHGFKVAIFKIKQLNPQFQYLSIEDIAHNNILINNLKKKTPTYLESPSAYFLYNYVHSPVNNNKTLVLI